MSELQTIFAAQRADAALDAARRAAQNSTRDAYIAVTKALADYAAYAEIMASLVDQVETGAATDAESTRLMRHLAVTPPEMQAQIDALLALAQQFAEGIHGLDVATGGAYFGIVE